MADVTGPISTLPGTVRESPAGIMCDEHHDRPATRRVQGETDSFGSEMHDLCEECYQAMREEMRRYAAEEARGACDWCGLEATDLRNARDWEEGMSGPVYRVCGGCIRRRNEEAREYDYDDYHY